jgi:hypothetical protein
VLGDAARELHEDATSAEIREQVGRDRLTACCAYTGCCSALGLSSNHTDKGTRIPEEAGVHTPRGTSTAGDGSEDELALR